jgi:Tfp pilus assembly protein PilE
MENLATANVAEQHLLAERFDLERQLQTAERHYADARMAADQARDEWRALSIRVNARPAQVLAARARFEAVAARCNRLRNVIDDLEQRLDD